jgi:hypothetical protein
MCLNVLGIVAQGHGPELRLARSLSEQALALSREVGDRWGTAWALTNLGFDLAMQVENRPM